MERQDLARPVSAIQLTHKTFRLFTKTRRHFPSSTNKGNPFKFPEINGKLVDKSKEIIDGYHQMKLDGLIIIEVMVVCKYLKLQKKEI